MSTYYNLLFQKYLLKILLIQLVWTIEWWLPARSGNQSAGVLGAEHLQPSQSHVLHPGQVVLALHGGQVHLSVTGHSVGLFGLCRDG